jgi:hypothetical protein
VFSPNLVKGVKLSNSSQVTYSDGDINPKSWRVYPLGFGILEIEAINEKARPEIRLAPFYCSPIDEPIYGWVFKVGRPASGPCVVGVTVKGACRVKVKMVSEGNLIC